MANRLNLFPFWTCCFAKENSRAVENSKLRAFTTVQLMFPMYHSHKLLLRAICCALTVCQQMFLGPQIFLTSMSVRRAHRYIWYFSAFSTMWSTSYKTWCMWIYERALWKTGWKNGGELSLRISLVLVEKGDRWEKSDIGHSAFQAKRFADGWSRVVGSAILPDFGAVG